MHTGITHLTSQYNEDDISAAELILWFVEALPESLIPSQYFEATCIAVANDRAKHLSWSESCRNKTIFFEYILRFFRITCWPEILQSELIHCSFDGCHVHSQTNHAAKLSANESSSVFNFFHTFPVRQIDLSNM